MRYTTAFLLTLLLLIGCNSNSTEPENKQILTNNPLASSLDIAVNQVIRPYIEQEQNVGLSLAFIRNDSIFNYGYGETEKGKNKLPDENTICEIGSISKTFTAALIVKMTHERGITINEPVSSLLPANITSLEKEGVKMTLAHLLNHTSGLPRLPEDFAVGMNETEPYKHYDSLKVYNYLRTNPLIRKPGELLEYSNLGFGILGLILERYYHKSYEQLVVEKICTPLDMNHTTLTVNSDKFAKGYNSFGLEMPYWDDMNAFKAAGSIRSSISDMLIYMQAQMGVRQTELNSIFAECHNISFTEDGVDIGLSWFVLPLNNTSTFFHDGGTYGFRTYMAFSKETRRGLLLFCNNDSDSTAELFNELAGIVFCN